jgi:hypothetical protein
MNQISNEFLQAELADWGVRNLQKKINQKAFKNASEIGISWLYTRREG